MSTDVAALERMRERAEKLVGNGSWTGDAMENEGMIVENLVAVVLGEEYARKSLVGIIGDHVVSGSAARVAGYQPLDCDSIEIAVPRRALPWRQQSTTRSESIHVRLKMSFVSTEINADETLLGVIWTPGIQTEKKEEALLYPGPQLEEESRQLRLCCPIVQQSSPLQDERGRLESFCPEHAAWCATQGFEYVFLGDENEDGPQRILDALGEAAGTCRPSPHSVILLAGNGAQALAETVQSRFPDSAQNLVRIETKYYTARVRLVVSQDTDIDKSAEALIILADSPEEAQSIWDGLGTAPQTKLLVSTAHSLDDWCLDNGFERVLTDNSQDGLPRIEQALQCTLWSTMQRKTPGAQDGGQDLAPQHNNTPSLCSPPAEEDDFNIDDNFDIASDDLDDILALVQQARQESGPNSTSEEGDQARRDRAAHLALRLARSLGIDDDDENN